MKELSILIPDNQEQVIIDFVEQLGAKILHNESIPEWQKQEVLERELEAEGNKALWLDWDIVSKELKRD